MSWGSEDWTPEKQIQLIGVATESGSLPSLDCLTRILCDDAARRAWALAVISGHDIAEEMPRLNDRIGRLNNENA
jgi:hypothetical protein